MFTSRDQKIIHETQQLFGRLAEDRLYELVLEEVELDDLDPVSKARAFEEAEGNPEKARALYIKHRIRRISDLAKAQSLRDAEKEAEKEKQSEEALEHEYEAWHLKWVSVDPWYREKCKPSQCWSEFLSKRGVAPIELLRGALSRDEPQGIIDALCSLGFSVLVKRNTYGLLLSYRVEKAHAQPSSTWHFLTGDDLNAWATSEYQKLKNDVSS